MDMWVKVLDLQYSSFLRIISLGIVILFGCSIGVVRESGLGIVGFQFRYGFQVAKSSVRVFLMVLSKSTSGPIESSSVFLLLPKSTGLCSCHYGHCDESIDILDRTHLSVRSRHRDLMSGVVCKRMRTRLGVSGQDLCVFSM